MAIANQERGSPPSLPLFGLEPVRAAIEFATSGSCWHPHVRAVLADLLAGGSWTPEAKSAA